MSPHGMNISLISCLLGMLRDSFTALFISQTGCLFPRNFIAGKMKETWQVAQSSLKMSLQILRAVNRQSILPHYLEYCAKTSGDRAERERQESFRGKRTTPHLEKVHNLAYRISSFHFDKLIR